MIATLWEVDDRSTGLLMEAFYRRFGDGGNETRLQRLRGRSRDPFQSEYRHPYYWAAFVLVGTSDAHSIST